MRLISCYVEGYGKIKQTEFDFNAGLTTFLWENGEGKSTLASFLKAMLYGLEGYRKGAVDFCDREHFYPFDGGRFGGNLRMEVHGKEYKIERFFAEKSETGDRLTVYEDGVLLSNPPVEIGRWLLNVDKKSFERTLFLRHDDLEIFSTTGILTQLNRRLESGEEEVDLDQALERLEKAAKRYKKRGGGDKITEEKEHIARLKAEIENASKVKASLDGKYARAETLREEMEGAKIEIRRAQAKREKASQMEHYDSILEGVAEAEKGLAAIAENYPFGVPTLEETKAFNAYLVAFNELQMKLDGGALTAQEKGDWAFLSARFAEGAPTESQLREVQEKIEGYKGLQILSAQSHTRSAREEALFQKFSRQMPTKESLEKGERDLAAYRDTLRKMGSASTYTQTPKGGVSAKGYAFAAVFALLLTVAGVVTLLMQFTLLGGGMAAVGGIVLLAVGFLYLNKKSGQSALVENAQRAALEREANGLESALQALLLPLGYGGEEGVEVGFAALKRDLQDYEASLEAEKASMQTRAQNQASARELEETLSAFFSRYGEKEGEYFTRFSALKTTLARWQALQTRQRECSRLFAQTQAEQEALQKKMAAYQAKYRLQTVNVEGVLQAAREKERLEDEAKKGKEKAAAFREEKGLERGQEKSVVDLEGLQAAYERMQSEYAKIWREIEEDERSAERLEGLELDKEQAEAQLKEYKRKHALLEATTALLKGASARLKDKYVKPVKDEFLRYAKVIEGALGERVIITKDFDLHFERNGVERSEKHLSSGQRSICALCFRLALIENMYEGKLPFLILDDPFLALDEGHIVKVKEVLQALSKEMQLIYFSCHSSRTL